MVQWLRLCTPNAGELDLIPAGIKLKLKILHASAKIKDPFAETKIRCSNKKKKSGNSNVGLSMGTGQETWKPNRENEHILLVGGDWGLTGWKKGLTDSRATEGLEVWLGMEDSSFQD